VAAGCAQGGAFDDGGPGRADAGPRNDAFVAPVEDAGSPDARVVEDAGLLDARVVEADSGANIAAPVVDGEPRADHRRPSWIWTVPAGATGFQVRLDGGAAEELDVATTVYTARADLSDGTHTFSVRARDAEGRLGPEGTFETTVALRAGFWRTDRAVATSPLG